MKQPKNTNERNNKGDEYILQLKHTETKHIPRRSRKKIWNLTKKGDIETIGKGFKENFLGIAKGTCEVLNTSNTYGPQIYNNRSRIEFKQEKFLAINREKTASSSKVTKKS